MKSTYWLKAVLYPMWWGIRKDNTGFQEEEGATREARLRKQNQGLHVTLGKSEEENWLG